MAKATTHEEQLVSLKKIEGQIRGVCRMIEEGRYCVDILTQLHSISGATHSVEDKILAKHLEGCVRGSLITGSSSEKHDKIDEVINLLKRFRK